MIRAGELTRLITIERMVETQDASGHPQKSWPVRAANVRAMKRDVKGDERFAAGQVVAETDTIFKIYWRADLAETDRVDYKGAKYQILAITEFGLREALFLHTQKHVSAED